MDEAETTVVRNLLLSAMAAADRAVLLEPNNVNNWLQRGNVYRDVMELVGGAEEVATALDEVAELEPANPIHPTNLARLYLMVADRAAALKTTEGQTEAGAALTTAEQYLNQALELKDDYALANYYLAAVYERQDKLAEAIAYVVNLREQLPNDFGLAFRLAMLYLENHDLTAAKKELEEIIAKSPDYSNAYWYLGKIYENEGDLVKATEMVAQVVMLNPDNEQVKSKLEALKAGQTSSEIVEPVAE